jgi:hypothetical protein
MPTTFFLAMLPIQPMHDACSCMHSTSQSSGQFMQLVMLASYSLSKLADSYVAESQRKDLDLCIKCGGLNEGVVDRCPLEDCPEKQKSI